MEQLQIHADAETEPLLTRTRQMLQEQLLLVDEGLADPQGFQYMMENQMQYGQDEEAIPEPNQQGEPGFHQNEESGKPAEVPGNGNGTGEGNEAPGGPNPDAPQNGSGGDSPGGNEAPGGPNPDSPGGSQDGQGGNGSGGGGGNK
jgi:hypothetical protein